MSSTSSSRGVRYRMLPSKDDTVATEVQDATCDEPQIKKSWLKGYLDRETYIYRITPPQGID